MAIWHFLTLICIILSGVEARIITLENKCKYTVWPGILIAEESNPLQELEGDLILRPGQSFNVTAPQHWTVSIWGGNGCSYNRFGHGKCVTGGFCGFQRCNGARIPSSPFTSVQLFLDTRIDVYEVTLSGGFNIPISISPYGNGSNECQAASCLTDFNRICPSELQVKSNDHIVACRSHNCLLDGPEHCCPNSTSSSIISNSETCMWTNYLMVLKSACPTASSGSEWRMFECRGANYLISFC